VLNMSSALRNVNNGPRAARLHAQRARVDHAAFFNELGMCLFHDKIMGMCARVLPRSRVWSPFPFSNMDPSGVDGSPCLVERYALCRVCRAYFLFFCRLLTNPLCIVGCYLGQAGKLGGVI